MPARSKLDHLGGRGDPRHAVAGDGGDAGRRSATTPPPAADDRRVEPGAQPLRLPEPAMVGLERGGEAHDHRHGRRCRADSRPPVRRTASSVASPTSRAPMPGGPPSLWAAMPMKSASGSGSLPALWAQSTSSTPFAALTRAAISSMRMDHAGLVVDRLDRDQRALASRPSRRRDRRGRGCRRASPRSGALAHAPAPRDARSQRLCATRPWRGAGRSRSPRSRPR